MAEMNNQVETTVVEVVETKENIFTKGLNKVKDIKLVDVAKGAALISAGALAVVIGGKVFGGNAADVVEDVMDIVEE